MNLYTFTHSHDQAGEGHYVQIFQVIAKDEESARQYLKDDGHNLVQFYYLESEIGVKQLVNLKYAGIIQSMEFEFTGE